MPLMRCYQRYKTHDEMFIDASKILASKRLVHFNFNILENGEYEIFAVMKHKNPSGFHNKIKWLLRASDRNIDNLDTIYKGISKECIKSRVSWQKAYKVARHIINEQTTGHFKSFRGEKEFISSLSTNDVKSDHILIKQTY